MGPLIELKKFVLRRFRRLRSATLDLHAKTTVLVGANDSGKTSLLLAIRKFMCFATGQREGGDFSGYDLSADGWEEIQRVGEDWLELPKLANDEDESVAKKRNELLARFLGVMPELDVWLEAREGAWHLVRDLIPSFEWSGGTVGLRIRLEPASTAEELDQLMQRYRRAKDRVRETNKPAASGRGSWPVDLLDYLRTAEGCLKHVQFYKLVQTSERVKGEAESLPPPPATWPLDQSAPLRALVRVDFIAAQRGFGHEEAAAGGASSPGARRSMLSDEVVDYAEELLRKDRLDQDGWDAQHYQTMAEALGTVHSALDEAFNRVMREPIKELKGMGYPSLGGLQEILLQTEVRPEHTLRHRTAIQYRSAAATEDSQRLPEHAIGLGYQNLLSLTFTLMRLRDLRIRSGQELAPCIHLVLLEEPEAHLHIQVHRSFIQNAYERIHPEKRPELSTHMVVTTHSSHLAHAVDFAQLRYLRRLPRSAEGPLPTSEVVSLQGTFEQDGEDTLLFAQRYLRVQHNDLLFADAAVLVEGTAERILLPGFIDQVRPELQHRYLSVLDVGGSHAHRLRPLLDRLEIPTLLITDLDPVGNRSVSYASTGGAQQSTGTPPLTSKSKKKHPTRQPVMKGRGQTTQNPSIKAWLGKTDIDELLDLKTPEKQKGQTRLAFQVPGDEAGACGSTLEDALILENRSWFAAPANAKIRAFRKVCQVVGTTSSSKKLAGELHTMVSNLDKGAFAMDLFMHMEAQHNGHSLNCPQYIREGLEWLASELARRESTVASGEQS
ncbi:MAG TPA: AAA family ATPase [Myxococcota bacterium]|nr:AAA family ATPase [Myxococcota bacterium]